MKYLVGVVGSALEKRCEEAHGVHPPSCGGGWGPGSGGDCPPGWPGEASSHAKDLGAERGFFRRRCRACGASRASWVAQSFDGSSDPYTARGSRVVWHLQSPRLVLVHLLLRRWFLRRSLSLLHLPHHGREWLQLKTIRLSLHQHHHLWLIRIVFLGLSGAKHSHSLDVHLWQNHLDFAKQILLQQDSIWVWKPTFGRKTSVLWWRLRRTLRSCRDWQSCWTRTRCWTPMALQSGVLSGLMLTGRFLTGTRLH